jgi:uncharacterized LabA/DUF88 family protein
LPQQDRLNIAVFIDFDNIEIGVKSTLGQSFDIGSILDAIKERGEVVTKIAYADWTRAGEYSRALTQHAIRLVQRNLTPGGDKNGADINLALDALEMAFTHPHINAYVIVGGDSDFLSLVEKLKQYDKKVFVVGGRGFTSIILQRNCHEFIAYENLSGVRRAAAKSGRPTPSTTASPIAQAFTIVRRALQILADREVSPQTGLLKSTLLQLDSTFSERNYGASSFLDFVEKLSHAGLVHLKHAGRSVMVELNERFDPGESGAARSDSPAAMHAPSSDEAASADTHAVFEPAPEAPSHDSAPPPQPQQSLPAADGVAIVARALAGATQARWPMYLRNVKQIIRAGASGFDERRYGFNGLMDLLRACQRDGLVRLERDRRGGLRVFPGQALQRAAVPRTSEPAPVFADLPDDDAQPIDVDMPPPPAIGRFAVDETEEGEIIEVPVAAVDTTAELLGRAKPKRPRGGRTSASGIAGTPPPAARKPARASGGGTRKAGARRTGRTKKAAGDSGQADKS